MRRNKRCLLAYHRIRTDKFDRLVWQGVDLVSNDVNHEGRQPDAQQPEDENSLSPEEEEYVRLYGDLISAYKGQWSDIDLTGSLEPPKDLFIDVRVLKDAGEIQTEYGYVGAASAGRYIPTHTGQCHQLDQEQPVLCAPGRCRAADPAGLLAKAELMGRRVETEVKLALICDHEWPVLHMFRCTDHKLLYVTVRHNRRYRNLYIYGLLIRLVTPTHRLLQGNRSIIRTHGRPTSLSL